MLLLVAGGKDTIGGGGGGGGGSHGVAVVDRDIVRDGIASGGGNTASGKGRGNHSEKNHGWLLARFDTFSR